MKAENSMEWAISRLIPVVFFAAAALATVFLVTRVFETGEFSWYLALSGVCYLAVGIGFWEGNEEMIWVSTALTFLLFFL